MNNEGGTEEVVDAIEATVAGSVTMRLLTYNIHKGVGSDRRYRLERIIDVLREQDPDLDLLAGSGSQCAALAFPRSAGPVGRAPRRGGPPLSTQCAAPRRRLRQPDPVALAVPQRMASIAPPSSPQTAPRQLVVVETPEGPLHLVNWHLGLREKERRWQALHLLSHRSFLESAHLPTIIAGDYNDWRNTLGKHHFMRHGFHQATAPIRRFRSFPVLPRPGRAGQDFLSRRHRTSDTPASCAAAWLDRASDHLPLVFDFHLTQHRRNCRRRLRCPASRS